MGSRRRRRLWMFNDTLSSACRASVWPMWGLYVVRLLYETCDVIFSIPYLPCCGKLLKQACWWTRRSGTSS
eukprot:3454128-Prorocentrum_lima.AAC.1